MAEFSSAPTYMVPQRDIVAVEHPMVIRNIDDGLKTFGTGVPLAHIADACDYEGSLPLYLRYKDPTCAPILSQNALSGNVLLKITVPKRTGRKRKRGSNEPFMDAFNGSELISEEEQKKGHTPDLLSFGRNDQTKSLLRRLRDNQGRYEIEPVGTIEQTHRYRGLSDFNYSTRHQKFMTKFRDTVLTGNMDDLRKFKLDPSRGPVPNTELIPPPLLTNHPLPFNWAYHQNPTIKTYQNPATGAKTLLNHSLPAKLGTLYLSPSVPSVPTGPPRNPPGDPLLLKLITDLNRALELRPIWTRRALTNQLAASPGLYLLKSAVQYVGYQFRGGPWRDAIIKYGIDPRTDPKYRIYQTVFFKIFDESEKVPGAPWVDIRSEYSRKTPADEGGNMSHIFDGKRISLDGKVWQICDITDPLLCNLAATASLRSECDIESDGWYTNGTWAKIKAIMRTKISAIRAGREMDDEEFEETLKYPDSVVDKTKPGMPRTKLAVPVPDWRQKGGPVRKGPPDNGRRKRRGGGKLKGAALGVGSRRKWKDVKIGVGSGANDLPVAQNRVGDLASLPGLRRPGAGSLDLNGAGEMGHPESSVYGGENVASSTYGGENLASSAYGGNEYDEDEDAEGEVYDEDEMGEAYDEDYDNQYGFGPREHEYGSDGLEG